MLLTLAVASHPSFFLDTVSLKILVAICKDESEPKNVGIFEYHFPISSGNTLNFHVLIPNRYFAS